LGRTVKTGVTFVPEYFYSEVTYMQRVTSIELLRENLAV